MVKHDVNTIPLLIIKNIYTQSKYTKFYYD